MGFTRRKSLRNPLRAGGRPELQKMTVIQLKQLHKDILASPYSLKLQTVMATRMKTGSVKEDYIQKILEMETHIQKFTESNEPLEDAETDKVRRRIERADSARETRLNEKRREMNNDIFDSIVNKILWNLVL